MRGRRLGAVPVGATAALLAGCWASHGPEPPPPPPPPPPPDASVPCEGLGAAACGCLGGLRRCDTCERPCPEGRRCVERLGVCVPEALLDTACTVAVETTRFGGWGCFGDGTRLCVGDAMATLAWEDPMRGLCLPWSYCAELGSAEPPLTAEVACRSPLGERLDGLPPVQCPGERLGGRPTCGPWCPWPSCPSTEEGRQVCAGLSEARGFGLCLEARTCRPEGRDACEERYGERCVCLRVVGTEPGLEPLGVMAPRSACRAYQERFPETVRCTER